MCKNVFVSVYVLKASLEIWSRKGQGCRPGVKSLQKSKYSRLVHTLSGDKWIETRAKIIAG